MKKSDVVVVAVTGTVYFGSMFYHRDIYQDRYISRVDCLKDWGDTEQDCREETNSSGAFTGRYVGPSYEEGARPSTRSPSLSTDHALVTRGGFGRSGARYTQGGG